MNAIKALTISGVLLEALATFVYLFYLGKAVRRRGSGLGLGFGSGLG